MIPFPEQLVATALGTIVLVLATVWVREKRRPPFWLVSLWWTAWLGSAGYSYFCMVRAGAVLGGDTPPDQRASLLAEWLNRGVTWRSVALVVLVAGLVMAALAVLRAPAPPDKNAEDVP